MTLPRRGLILLAVLLGSIGCDQGTKTLARASLMSHPDVVFLGGALRLTYARNPGAFLSLGAQLPPALRTALLCAGVAALLAALLWWTLQSKRSALELCAGALILGGGLSNLADRLAHGWVPDFAVLAVGPLHTGVFNVADLAIVAGVGLLALQRRRQPA